MKEEDKKELRFSVAVLVVMALALTLFITLYVNANPNRSSEIMEPKVEPESRLDYDIREGK